MRRLRRAAVALVLSACASPASKTASPPSGPLVPLLFVGVGVDGPEDAQRSYLRDRLQELLPAHFVMPSTIGDLPSAGLDHAALARMGRSADVRYVLRGVLRRTRKGTRTITLTLVSVADGEMVYEYHRELADDPDEVLAEGVRRLVAYVRTREAGGAP
jgi:hypothetical protein